MSSVVHYGASHFTLCGLTPLKGSEFPESLTTEDETAFDCAKCRRLWAQQNLRWKHKGLFSLGPDSLVGIVDPADYEERERVTFTREALRRVEVRARAREEREREERKLAGSSSAIPLPDPYSYVGMGSDYADIDDGVFEQALARLDSEAAEVDCDEFENEKRTRRTRATRPPAYIWFSRWLLENGFM